MLCAAARSVAEVVVCGIQLANIYGVEFSVRNNNSILRFAILFNHRLLPHSKSKPTRCQHCTTNVCSANTRWATVFFFDRAHKIHRPIFFWMICDVAGEQNVILLISRKTSLHSPEINHSKIVACGNTCKSVINFIFLVWKKAAIFLPTKRPTNVLLCYDWRKKVLMRWIADCNWVRSRKIGSFRMIRWNMHLAFEHFDLFWHSNANWMCVCVECVRMGMEPKWRARKITSINNGTNKSKVKVWLAASLSICYFFWLFCFFFCYSSASLQMR